MVRQTLVINRQCFWIGLAGILILSLALRFWGLGRFNTLVFDEVYYAKFANNYLTGTKFFDGHPPLSKYIIAIGMWIGDRLPFGQEVKNGLTGSLHAPWTYRWVNALTGSFIPWVIAGIAYQISRRYSFALVAALLAALDGMFLVESRYALNNVYLVIFGLLGQLCLLMAVSGGSQRRWWWLLLSGIWFGATISVKWNGLWFLLGAYFFWAVAWIFKVLSRRSRKEGKTLLPPLLENTARLNVFHLFIYLGVVPIAFYGLQWIPHLQLNPEYDLWEVQQQILGYHKRVGDGPKVHPYCSRWFTWLWMIRPVAYFYRTPSPDNNAILPPLPPDPGQLIFDVHAMGNPVLWWLSSLAMFVAIALLVQKFSEGEGSTQPLTPSTTTVLYLGLNWFANLLPWMPVTRCTFLYHYMGCSVFAGLTLAWIVDRWLHHPDVQYRNLALVILGLIAIAFLFWMPIYLGLPLSPWEYRLRMWLPSWV